MAYPGHPAQPSGPQQQPRGAHQPPRPGANRYLAAALVTLVVLVAGGVTAFLVGRGSSTEPAARRSAAAVEPAVGHYTCAPESASDNPRALTVTAGGHVTVFHHDGSVMDTWTVKLSGKSPDKVTATGTDPAWTNPNWSHATYSAGPTPTFTHLDFGAEPYDCKLG